MIRRFLCWLGLHRWKMDADNDRMVDYRCRWCRAGFTLDAFRGEVVAYWWAPDAGEGVDK